VETSESWNTHISQEEMKSKRMIYRQTSFNMIRAHNKKEKAVVYVAKLSGTH